MQIRKFMPSPGRIPESSSHVHKRKWTKYQRPSSLYPWQSMLAVPHVAGLWYP